MFAASRAEGFGVLDSGALGGSGLGFRVYRVGGSGLGCSDPSLRPCSWDPSIMARCTPSTL